MMMRNFILIFCSLMCIQLNAQKTLNVHSKDGTINSFKIEDIDSIRVATNVNKPTLCYEFNFAKETLSCDSNQVYLDLFDVIDIDLSPKDFLRIYPLDAARVSVNGYYDTSISVWDYTDYDGSLDLEWTLTNEEIGTIVSVNTNTTPHTWSLKNNEFIAVLEFKPIDNIVYSPIKITIKRTFVIDNYPEIYNLYGNYWYGNGNGNICHDILPVQYYSSTQQMLGNKTCVYHSNLASAFLKSYNGTIFTNMNSCSAWDIQFCKDNQPSGFSPDTNLEPNSFQEGGYQLINGSSVAASLLWHDGHSAWENCTDLPFLTINKNSAGAKLIGNKIHIGIWATINPYNVIPVFDYDVEIVDPLNIKLNSVGEFYDNTLSGSSIDISDLLNITDCWGYKVAPTTTGTSEKEKYARELYNYYEVSAPQWSMYSSTMLNIRVGLKWSGNYLVVDNSATPETAMTMSELSGIANSPKLYIGSDNTLTLYSKMVFFEPFTIWAKMVVSYGWGYKTMWVPFKVNPNL